jgi:OmcA/MtrC family decaheme c-type cytochrome
MKSSTTWWTVLTLLLATVAGCGSDGNGGSTPPSGDVAAAISAAARVPANDSAINPFAPFTVLQGAGQPAVAVASPPKVNFTVFSDGAVKTGLTLADMSFAIAKLVPGTNGNPDEWQNYVSRKATATATDSPGAAMTPPATAMQATTDPKRTPEELAAAGLGPQLVYNDAGYYTYTFSADITDPSWSATINKTAYSTNGVVFDPNATHRVAIQLSYKNAAGEVVRVNPHFAFRFVKNAAGGYDSVLLTDPATQDYVMTDVSSCNACHEKLALHGGGRVDVQYCVMCHNPGTTDPDSGNVLTMSTMTHKIHAGRGLAGSPGGENYTIWGYNNVKYDYSEIGFPQALQNCAKCHTAQNPSTPQGDNWKSVPSREACLTCHASNAGSTWDDSHTLFAQRFHGPTATTAALTNADCASCHRAGTDFGSDIVHFNQIEVNSALYKMNIESTTFNDTADHKGRTVTVKYFLSNPSAGDSAYNLVTSDCTGTAAAPVCSNTTKFGNLRFYLAYQNMAGQSTAVTEYTSYNNGGNSANAFAYKGSNDGSNHYTVNIPLPDDVPPNIVATGTAQVASAGQVKEPTLRLTSAANPRPPAVPASLTNVVVQHTSTELALSGTLQPRRVIVSNDKCNVCHGALGSTSGSNTLANAFHGGGRDTVQVCVTCHDVNKASSGTVMTSGLSFQESYQFKRMIHGIHGNSKRQFPYTNGNKVIGPFDKGAVGVPSKLTADGIVGVDYKAGTAAGCIYPAEVAGAPVATGTPLLCSAINYAAEVFWPGNGVNCNACHVNNSFQNDRGPLGAVVLDRSALGVPGAPVPIADAWQRFVISPQAATCTACHDSPRAIGHVTSFGNATFGNLAQNAWPQETCADCHAGGLFMGVDRVHGIK